MAFDSRSEVCRSLEDQQRQKVSAPRPHKDLVSDLPGERTCVRELPPQDEPVYVHQHQKEFSRQPQLRRDFETHVDV
jgi:hypothetical protein